MTRNHLQAFLLALGALLILCCGARAERPFSEVLAEARAQVQGATPPAPTALPTPAIVEAIGALGHDIEPERLHELMRIGLKYDVWDATDTAAVRSYLLSRPDAAVPSSDGSALPAVVPAAASGLTQGLRERIATFKANGGRQWYQRSGNGYVTSLDGIRRHLKASHEYPPGAEGLTADELAWLHGTYHEPQKLQVRTAQQNTRWVQQRVCRNGVCRLEWVQVP